jgi:oxygen-dependent protoporphyrinogen oxidase
MKPIAIIGGGITGLTAAFRLKQQNLPVTVFEASERVGGVIQSVRQNGHLAEFGPNSILETSPLVAALVRDLGLESRRLYSDARAEKRYIVRGGQPVLLPSSPWAFLTSPLFSPAAKLRLLAEPFIGRAPADSDESIAEFVRRRLGQEFLDYAINPLVAGIYAGDPELLSVAQAFPKLHALEQRWGSLIVGQVRGARERQRSGEVSKQNAKKFSFDEGLQVLIDTLRTNLAGQIQSGAPVRSLEHKGGGWLVELDNHKLGEAPSEFSAILLALPAYKMAGLAVRATDYLDLSRLSAIHYPPVASVVLGFRRVDVAHPLDGFGMLVPEKEGFNILGALFSSSLFPNRAPEGEVTITCYLGGARSPNLTLRTSAELVELAAKDLSVLLGIKGKTTFQRVTLFPRAIPQYNLGFGGYRAFMNDLELKAPGLFLAGHARDGISVSDCIVSGHQVAARILTFLSASDKKTPLPQLHLAA